MISYEVLLQQMAQHVAQATKASDEQQMREQLTAVKALCDVVLGSEVKQPLQQPKLQSRMLASTPTPTMQPKQAQKLQEADANGDSIFDF